jgi:multicomponent Na+:H+ antiporter subunit E
MSVARRSMGFLLLWLVLAGTAPSDLVVGACAALAAGWASVRVWPPGAVRLRPLLLAWFALRMIGQAVASGVEVARLALDPRAKLRPGLVAVPVALPAGAARDVFLTLISTVPGTIPAGPGDPDTAEAGSIMVHCLDTADPVAADFAAEAARFARAIGRASLHA